ncbi:hypothetical protein BGW80DRAFT_1413697 [Lactifluus volemus]|nr:hypothetical protein BGW80DRAFT_1413697 [Lactifluus volemus]
MYRSPAETLHRLTRGWRARPPKPETAHRRIARIYRGLGVSALRSVTTHGLLWTFFDLASGFIDSLPESPA